MNFKGKEDSTSVWEYFLDWSTHAELKAAALAGSFRKHPVEKSV